MGTKRAMAIAMRVAGNKEGDGKGGKGDSDGNEEMGNIESYGDSGKGNSNGNEDGGGRRGQCQGWQERWRQQ